MIMSKFIINKLVDVLRQKFKLDKMFNYVFDDNELDETSKNHEDRIRILESIVSSSKICNCKEKKQIK